MPKNLNKYLVDYKKASSHDRTLQLAGWILFCLGVGMTSAVGLFFTLFAVVPLAFTIVWGSIVAHYIEMPDPMGVRLSGSNDLFLIVQGSRLDCNVDTGEIIPYKERRIVFASYITGKPVEKIPLKEYANELADDAIEEQMMEEQEAKRIEKAKGKGKDDKEKSGNKEPSKRELAEIKKAEIAEKRRRIAGILQKAHARGLEINKKGEIELDEVISVGAYSPVIPETIKRWHPMFSPGTKDFRESGELSVGGIKSGEQIWINGTIMFFYGRHLNWVFAQKGIKLSEPIAFLVPDKAIPRVGVKEEVGEVKKYGTLIDNLNNIYNIDRAHIENLNNQLDASNIVITNWKTTWSKLRSKLIANEMLQNPHQSEDEAAKKVDKQLVEMRRGQGYKGRFGAWMKRNLKWVITFAVVLFLIIIVVAVLSSKASM